MCIAILKTPQGEITKEQLETCFKNNPDMCGLAFVNTRKAEDGTNEKYLAVWKGYTDFETFYADYRRVAELKDRNILIHFRIATSGGVNELNCHPFQINDSLVMIHNGVLGSFATPAKDSPYNDTQTYIQKYMVGLPNNIYKNPTFKKLMGEMIGHNKFVLLDIHDHYYIINENLGHWDKGVWFSNYSYKAVKSTGTKVVTTKYGTEEYWGNSKYYSDYYNGYYGGGVKTSEKKQEDSETMGQKRYCECCGVELLDNEDLFCDDCWEGYIKLEKDAGVDTSKLKWCSNCKCLVTPDVVWVRGERSDECPYCGNPDLTAIDNIREDKCAGHF